MVLNGYVSRQQYGQWHWLWHSLMIFVVMVLFQMHKLLTAQSVCQRAFSLMAIWCLSLWVRNLHSAEEDNPSPFDLNIACLCQSIKINNNKHVYRQSQERKPAGRGVQWAECSLIIGTGCWVQVFTWSSISQSVCQLAFSLLAIWSTWKGAYILPSSQYRVQTAYFQSFLRLEMLD